MTSTVQMFMWSLKSFYLKLYRFSLHLYKCLCVKVVLNVISWYLISAYSFFSQELVDVGKWSYLRILQDARLIAVKKQKVC